MNFNRLPQSQNEAGRWINLFGTLNNKFFDFKNDYCPQKKGSSNFVDDCASELIALHLISTSSTFSDML